MKPPAALDDLADHVKAGHPDHPETDPAVVDQQPVAGAGVLGQPLVGGRHPVVGTGHILYGDPDLLADAPLDGTGGEAAQPDFRHHALSGTGDRRALHATRRSCTATPPTSSGCPAARGRSRSSAGSMPSTVLPRSAGHPPRINSVLTYGERPGIKLNELTQKLFYGGTA